VNSKKVAGNQVIGKEGKAIFEAGKLMKWSNCGNKAL
jgi:hypothetical protein